MKILGKKVYQKIRHHRVRKKVFGTPDRPRLSVFKSGRHIYAQIIDDTKGKTIASASSLETKKSKQDKAKKSLHKSDSSVKVGELVAKRAVEKGVKKIVFDRGGFSFHGRIKQLAEAARKGGLNF